MNKRCSSVVFMSAALLYVSACSGSQGDDDITLGGSPAGHLGAEALNANALNANALNANGLIAGTLSAVTLSGSALAPNAVDPSVLAALRDPGIVGNLTRQFLSYTVSCALDSTGSFSFSWTDSAGVEHDETYPGLLGLAPGWASGPLDAAGQRWVSACLVSRVNYYGVHVTLSSRGSSPALATSADEIASYTHEEGAFWGNLFAWPPSAFSCDYAPDVGHSRAAYRDCAAGHITTWGTVVPCGIIQLTGSCDTRCAPLDPALGYHPSCTDADGSTSPAVITVFLP